MEMLICVIASLLLAVVVFFAVGILYFKQKTKDKRNFCTLMIYVVAIFIFVNASAINFVNGYTVEGVLWILVIQLQIIIAYMTVKN